MTIKLIKTLIPYLPRYSEEGGESFGVKRTELIKQLISSGCTHEVAENTLAIVEALLDTLAALNPDYLQRGEWRFVSFPAQLMALSVLTAMSDTHSKIFKQDFWNTTSSSIHQKNEQRHALKAVENKRLAEHLTSAAEPIRYIHVAWSLIKYEDQILFHQREDTKKRFEETAGDYGLVGGRVNQSDMAYFDGNLKEKLCTLQSDNVNAIQPALEETLKRELLEEVGLIYENHYLFKPWRALKPYQQVQGAAPNHALTQYFFTIFSIELTLEGFFYLQEKVKKGKRLVWFSLDDISEGKRKDDKRAYINAIYKDFDDDKAALKQTLSELESSFSANYLVNKKNYGVTLMANELKPLIAGKFGKESLVSIDVTAGQRELLMGLAAHLRGFKMSNLNKHIVLHPHGWVEVIDDEELIGSLVKLSEKELEPLKVENKKDRYFRLSMLPQSVFFDDSFFSFSVDKQDLLKRGGKVSLKIQRSAMQTPLGDVEPYDGQCDMTISAAKGLEAIHLSEGNDSQLDVYKKSAHKEVQKIGMRGMVRIETGVITMCDGFRVNKNYVK